jgi:hypothetical protein
MTIQQISVFLENKPGRLADVLLLLGKKDITIHALTIADTSEYGLLRMITGDIQRAVQILKEQEIACNLSEVLAISIPDKAGESAVVLSALDKAGISIDYMYAFSRCEDAIMIIKPTNINEANKVLINNNVKFISQNDL